MTIFYQTFQLNWHRCQLICAFIGCSLLSVSQPLLADQILQDQAAVQQASTSALDTAFSPPQKKTLRLGIYMHQGRAILEERYQPFIAYLKQALPDYQLEWGLYSPSDFKEALQKHELDLLFTDPSLYQLIRFENSLGAPIATAKRIRNGVVISSLGGTIFTLASHQRINQLEDLTRARIAIPTFSNTGAYRVPLYELHKIGIRRDQLDFITVGTNDDVVKAVLDGRAEVGFVCTGILEDWIKRGLIKRSDFKLINLQYLPAFPFWLSSQLVPEWPFFALSHVDMETVKALTVALYQLQPDDPAVTKLGLAGFQPAKDYLALEEMLKEMNLPPFERDPSAYWWELWRTYQIWIVVAILLLVGFVLLSGLRERLLLKVQASEQQANEARIKAQKADAAKSGFLANMSHEIRTPLNAIIVMAQLGQTDKQLRSCQLHHQKVHHSAKLLLRILNDLLDFSKIEAGELKIDQQQFMLKTVLDDIANLFAPLAQGKGLSFAVTCSEDKAQLKQWRLTGDNLRLGQILANLLGNAIKFTEQGKVTLTVSLEQQKNNQAWLKFCVSDTGKGIPKEQYEYLFQRFSQGDASITRRFGGTGLGLAISQRLVQAMGGTGIEFESVEGQGTRFWMILPFTFEAVTADSVEQVSQLDPVKSRPALQGQVLLVEDNAINQEVAKELLADIGVSVDVCENGQKGVEAIANKQYDAVLMDIQMPVMDGYEATRQVRLFNQNVPIIALTAAAMEDELKPALEQGMNHYLTKPIDLDALYCLLAEYLPAK